MRSDGDYGIAPAGGTRTIVTHQPVGVAALVTPWNFPAAMVTRKIAPALAAGCTVVLKPAAETPLTALAVARMLAEAGVPDGVVNVVPTTDPADVVTAWLDGRAGPQGLVHRLDRGGARPCSGRPPTGCSTPAWSSAATRRSSSPPDADLDAAVAGAMVAKFRNGGQACTAANRFYVHAESPIDFVARFGAAVAALQVGAGSDPAAADRAADQRRARVENVGALVDEAVAAGAPGRHRGPVPDGGLVLPARRCSPTYRPTPRSCSEEIFGPVAPVVTWTDEAELLELVNDTEMGLAAYVYAGRLQDAPAPRRAHRGRHGRHQPRRRLRPVDAVRRRQAERAGGARVRARGCAEFQETRYFSVDLGDGEGSAVELEDAQRQVVELVQPRHRAGRRPCGRDVHLADQVAAHVAAAVARDDPAVRVEDDEPAARRAQGREQPLLGGIDAHVGSRPRRRTGRLRVSGVVNVSV